MIRPKDLPSTDRLNNIWFEGLPDDKVFEHANFTLYATSIYVTKQNRFFLVKVKGRYNDGWYGKWTVLWRTDIKKRALQLFAKEIGTVVDMYSEFFASRSSPV